MKYILSNLVIDSFVMLQIQNSHFRLWPLGLSQPTFFSHSQLHPTAQRDLVLTEMLDCAYKCFYLSHISLSSLRLMSAHTGVIDCP